MKDRSQLIGFIKHAGNGATGAFADNPILDLRPSVSEAWPHEVRTFYQNWLVSITEALKENKIKKKSVEKKKPGQQYLDLRKSKW